MASKKAGLPNLQRTLGIGCGDNSCIFGPPDGMATNGGCRCIKRGKGTTMLQSGILEYRNKFDPNDTTALKFIIKTARSRDLSYLEECMRIMPKLLAELDKSYMEPADDVRYAIDLLKELEYVYRKELEE